MLNPNLTNVVIASLRAAGITPPELTPIRPFPKSQATMEDLIEILLASEYEDPYQDPKAIALASQLYIQSLGHLDQGHYQRERQRQASDLEAHTDTLLRQLQEAFNKTAKSLTKHAEHIKGAEHPAIIDVRTADRGTAMAATNVIQELMALENIIKAWGDLWTALGENSYGVERGKPFTFMNPNAQQWEDLRRKPTIWEAVRSGIALTLADSPAHVSERFQAMINNEQAALEALWESKHTSLLPAEGYGTFKP
ncbi:hypothetical protein [Arthrobacter sp. StoSoilB20]|uniref:hypothetical protein n=1 Tax=Arthrobacter sp. StoSoilB20 TaxID=2830995 RepID=UPI001CC72D35|nr:hypothetical protein [Arthrobacter sp. StoSoilB20]BCW59584.1 hypothetical protein StoSoilB20_29310 [Arthrobacter sp. StoSoilB20]